MSGADSAGSLLYRIAAANRLFTDNRSCMHLPEYSQYSKAIPGYQINQMQIQKGLFSQRLSKAIKVWEKIYAGSSTVSIKVLRFDVYRMWSVPFSATIEG